VATVEISDDVRKKVAAAVKGKFNGALCHAKKEDQSKAVEALYEDVLAQFDTEAEDFNAAAVKSVFEQLEYEHVRHLILKENKRCDGRKYDEIRAVSCEVGLLPRTHGSALFTRGETQSLCVTTLGTKDDIQNIDALEGDIAKRFMLHYNFPSFSVGESKPNRGPGRREIGHGALAERALEPMLPGPDSFPYTIRLVSDILESNGSSSMATVCGGTLALMDAGVPLQSPVAGIAMGLIREGDEFAVLTDIAGVEDHLGDMDFKVAGTQKGITALQMDIKIAGVNFAILQKALDEAHKGRLKLLDIMKKTITSPRTELSLYAPRITTIQINPEKIKDIIGPGGKIIKKIIEETGVTIDIEETGKVFIGSTDQKSSQRAIEIIQEITQEAEVGKIYNGKVRKIMPFGAFCEILPGMDGLVHVSELADKYVAKVEDIVKVGDIIPVKVINIDQQTGKISLSAKKAKEETQPQNAE
jgi:polyribonucleotide nucleotidyltransferase